VGSRVRLDIIEKKKYLVLARIQTPGHPAQSLFTVPTTQFWLNIASYQNHCMKQGL
jgi:hypothetical protein